MDPIWAVEIKETRMFTVIVSAKDEASAKDLALVTFHKAPDIAYDEASAIVSNIWNQSEEQDPEK